MRAVRGQKADPHFARHIRLSALSWKQLTAAKRHSMRDIIEWVLEMSINPGQMPNVQPLLDEMVAATKADEPGALHYEYYMNADRTLCTVIERYTDNAAIMVHLGNFGAKFAERFLAAFTPVRFTVYGPADATVRAALAGFGATHQDMIAGFHR
jgi:quinol monooxygenase YgiN